MLTRNLDNFFRYFLNAPQTWEVRRDGVPFEFLDILNEEEKLIAENEFIKIMATDHWAIQGLARFKSEKR